MNNEKTRSLLITGGAGFIGSNFVHYWAKKYPNDKLTIIDALTYAGNLSSISTLIEQKCVEFVHGNICNQPLIESLLIKNEIHIIVNFAAESHVDKSIESADAFIQTNVVGTLSLLNAAKNIWLNPNKMIVDHKFHHISTDEVYGSLKNSEPAFTEQHQYQPNSPYAASKASSDHLVRSYHETYGLKTTTSNCSNNFGPYHFPEKLIPLTITNILNNKKIPIYGDGKQIRDWLFVTDHCKAIDCILQKGKSGGVYNVGGNNEWHNIDIVKAICQLVEQKFEQNHDLTIKYPDAHCAISGTTQSLLEHITDRLGHDKRYAVNASHIKNSLGFSPQENFIELLEKTIDWYLDNEDWWRSLL